MEGPNERLEEGEPDEELIQLLRPLARVLIIIARRHLAREAREHDLERIRKDAAA